MPKVTFDLTNNTSIYAGGDCIGSAIAIATSNFAPGSVGKIGSISVSDLSKQNTPLNFIFFDSTPNATTFTDNGALDIADSDLYKVFATASLTHSAYTSFADNSVATQDFDIPISTSAVGGLFMAVTVGQSFAPTYDVLSALKVTLLLE